jgi:hypothetical protein
MHDDELRFISDINAKKKTPGKDYTRITTRHYAIMLPESFKMK